MFCPSPLNCVSAFSPLYLSCIHTHALQHTSRLRGVTVFLQLMVNSIVYSRHLCSLSFCRIDQNASLASVFLSNLPMLNTSPPHFDLTFPVQHSFPFLRELPSLGKFKYLEAFDPSKTVYVCEKVRVRCLLSREFSLSHVCLLCPSFACTQLVTFAPPHALARGPQRFSCPLR